MKNYQHGPSGERPPDFNYGRGDPPEGLNNSNRMPFTAFWHNRKIWLTCFNSVCQDFLRLNAGEIQLQKMTFKL